MHQNPFEAAGTFYRGNLHAHTTQSDGDLSPEHAVRTYRRLGYHFLAITDHNTITEPPATNDGFLVLKGVEVTCGPYHLLGIGLDEVPAQRPEDEVGAAIAEITQKGGLPLLAHPYWSGLSTRQCAAARECLALEVYNTGCDLEIARGYSFVHWDDMLSSGIPTCGVAVDDGHHAAFDHGGGWVWIRAPELSTEAIMAALARGCYYSSCGPTIEGITVTDHALSVRCSAVREIALVSGPGTGSCVRADPLRPLTEASFSLAGLRGYVRVQMTDALGRMAWSNPFRLNE